MWDANKRLPLIELDSILMSSLTYKVLKKYNLVMAFNLKTEGVFCEKSVDVKKQIIYVESLHIKRRDVYKGNGKERVMDAVDEIINYARSNGLKRIEYSTYGKKASESVVSDVLERKGFNIESGKGGYSAVLEL